MEKEMHESIYKRKGSKKMEGNGITISIDRFAELIRKESAYDTFTKIVKENKYASEVEKALFVANPFEKDGEK